MLKVFLLSVELIKMVSIFDILLQIGYTVFVNFIKQTRRYYIFFVGFMYFGKNIKYHRHYFHCILH